MQLRQQLAPRVVVNGLLGEGAMGAVYRGRDQSLRRDVAIKVLRDDLAADPEARARFMREAQAAAALRHPGVVAVFEVGTIGDDGPPFFIMEFVSGPTLAERYPAGTRAPARDVERTIGEVAAALSAAHEKGLVHRDIKPSNLLIQRETGQVVVADFGISTTAQPAAGDQRLTATGAYIGTPLYMSPEQAGASAATAASDIYSLGCVAYELLAGRQLFEANSMIALLAAHLKDTPAPLDTLRPDADHVLLALVHRMLAKDPAARPSAREVAATLGATEALLEWPPPGTAPWQGSLARAIHQAAIGGCCTAVASGIAFSPLGDGSTLEAASVIAVSLVFLSAGAVTLLRAGAGVVGVIRGVTAMRAAGYGVGLMLEVLADSGNEMSDLIAGGRSFGGLSEARRRAVRRARLFALALYVWSVGAGLGVAMTLVTLSRSDATGSEFVGMFAALWAVAWALLALVLELWTPTPTRLLAFGRWGHRRHAAVPEADVVRAWGERRDVRGILREDPPGRFGTLLVGVLIIQLVATLVAAVIVLPPIVMIGLVGPAAYVGGFPRFDNVRQRLSRVFAVAKWELPVDSSISALEAGRVAHSLRNADSQNTSAWIRPLGDPLPALPDLAVQDSLLFRGLRSGAGGGWFGAVAMKIIPYARRGLTSTEREWLAALSRHPRLRALETLARAPYIDFYGAVLPDSLPPNASSETVPIMRFAGIKDAANASVSVAAHFASLGRTEAADSTLRVTLTAGVRMARGGNTAIEALIGAAISSIAIRGLQQLYEAALPEQGTALRLALASGDSTFLLEESTSRHRPAGVPDAIRLAARMAMDTMLVPGIRWEMAHYLALSRCASPLAVIRGRPPDADSVLTRLRPVLARTASAQRLWNLLLETPAHMRASLASMDNGEPSVLSNVREGVWASRVLRAPVIEDCTAVVRGAY